MRVHCAGDRHHKQSSLCGDITKDFIWFILTASIANKITQRSRINLLPLLPVINMLLEALLITFWHLKYSRDENNSY